MNKYTNTIHFKYLDTIFWSLSGSFSKEFTAGFLYGGIHALSIVSGENSYYHFDFYADRTAHSYNNQLFVLRKFPDIFIRKSQIAAINRRLTVQGVRRDHYAMWLSFREQENVTDAWLAIFSSLDFLQGIMTNLRAFGIIADRVLLTMPIKDNVMYRIQGIDLTEPNDLYTPERIVLPPVEDPDEEEYYE